MFEKQISLRSIVASVFALVVFAGLCSVSLAAQNATRDNSVYLMTNNTRNSIIQFRQVFQGCEPFGNRGRYEECGLTL